MNKNNVRVLIDTPEKAKEAYRILTEAKENIFHATEDRLQRGGIEHYSHIIYASGSWSGSNDCNRTIISIGELAKLLNVKTMENYSVSRTALKEIYEIVCSEWQMKIKALLINQSNIFLDNVDVPEDLVEKAYIEASQGSQQQWLLRNTPKRKKKVKKTVEAYLNVYADGSVYAHETKKGAENTANNACIAKAVRVNGEYEIEE